jgi:hypothetical protein
MLRLLKDDPVTGGGGGGTAAAALCIPRRNKNGLTFRRSAADIVGLGGSGSG